MTRRWGNQSTIPKGSGTKDPSLPTFWEIAGAALFTLVLVGGGSPLPVEAEETGWSADWTAPIGPEPREGGPADAGTWPLPRSEGLTSAARLHGGAANWTKLEQAVRPAARRGLGLAYDSGSDRVVLFGGFAINKTGDTWEYDMASGWVQASPASSPTPRSFPAMAYDSQSDRVILYGGATVNAWDNETWAYDADNDTWTRMNPVTSPASLHTAGIAYDSRSDRIVLFGGLQSSGRLDETWAYHYDNDSWTKRNPAVKPSARGVDSMAYDAQSDRVVLYGGKTTGVVNGETWTYDYGNDTWKDMKPTTRPPPLSDHATTYDRAADRVILHGGFLNPGASNETWAYHLENNSWEMMSPVQRPTGRWDHQIAYDTGARRVLLFGGWNSSAGANGDETWEYGPPEPAVVSTTPHDGAVGVSLDSTIGISFSKPMNRSSAESAISASPAVSGRLSWEPLSRTVTWRPGNLLLPLTDYTVTVSANAKGQSGAGMVSPYSFMFRTGPPLDFPVVVATDPRDGETAVPLNTSISVTFSFPMDTAASEAAISVAPALQGAFNWSSGDTIVTWDPDAELAEVTKYSVTIEVGARSKNGTPLPAAHRFSFTTLKRPVIPRVLETVPASGGTEVALDSNITLAFSVEMDRASVNGALSAVPTIAGKFAWDIAGRNLTWDPGKELRPETEHTVTLATAAKSKEGVPIASEFATRFTTVNTPPKIVHTPVRTLREGSPLELSAKVTDEGGVAEVKVIHRMAGSGGWATTRLSREGTTDLYSGTVAAERVTAGTLEYYIEGVDRGGLSATDPAKGETGPHQVIVTARTVTDFSLVWIGLGVAVAVIVTLVAVPALIRRLREG